MGDRAYEAAVGRFTQADRLILDGLHPLAANRYLYAMGDPVNWTDLTGGATYPQVMAGLAFLSRLLTVVGSIVGGVGVATGNKTLTSLGAGIASAGLGIGLVTTGYAWLATLGLLGVEDATLLAFMSEIAGYIGFAAGASGARVIDTYRTKCTVPTSGSTN